MNLKDIMWFIKAKRNKLLNAKKGNRWARFSKVSNWHLKPENQISHEVNLWSSGDWPRDLAIPVRYSNQLSYEATDVGSWSILGSDAPVKDMKVNNAYEGNHMWNADMKSNEEWSPQLWSQFIIA